MLINVTQADIDSGQRCSVKSCPVALAIKRIVGHDCVCITFRGIKIGKRIHRITANVIKWIVEFDSNMKSKPFKFSIGD